VGLESSPGALQLAGGGLTTTITDDDDDINMDYGAVGEQATHAALGPGEKRKADALDGKVESESRPSLPECCHEEASPSSPPEDVKDS
jgi:hypothetical protein